MFTTRFLFRFPMPRPCSLVETRGLSAASRFYNNAAQQEHAVSLAAKRTMKEEEEASQG